VSYLFASEYDSRLSGRVPGRLHALVSCAGGRVGEDAVPHPGGLAHLDEEPSGSRM